MSDVSLSKAVRANLLSLQNTAQMMDKTQNRLATGNKVNSALDNPSSFFTASALNSRAADMNNLLDSMASGIKVIEAASNGLTSITKTVESMQSTLRQARQDKSFQSQTFDVTKDSVLSLTGGQFGETADIKLQGKKDGVTAGVSSTTNYTGVTPKSGEGLGARTLINFNTSLGDGSIKVDGKDINLADGGNSITVTDAATKVQNQLNTGDTNGKYKVSVVSNKIVIEKTDPAAAAAKVEFPATGVDMATQGKTVIKYDPATVGTVEVTNADGDKVGIETGTSFDEFVAGLKAKEKDGDYTVSFDKSAGTITLTNTKFGPGAPAIDIPNSEAAITGSAAIASSLTGVAGADLTAAEPNFSALAGQTVILTSTPAGHSVTYTFTADPTGQKQALLDTLNKNGFTVEATDSGLKVGRADGREVTIASSNAAVQSTVGFGATVTSTNGIEASPALAAQTATMTGTGGTLTADRDALAGQTITLSVGDYSATYTFTDTTSGADQSSALEAALSKNGFTAVVDGTGNPVFTRADGQDFKITMSNGATATAAGLSNFQVSTGGEEAKINKAEVKGKTETPGVNGVFVENVAAATDEVSVTYGDKTAKLEILGMKAPANPSGATATEIADYQASTVKSINDQLAAQGIKGVAASFDASGKLQFNATTAEAKTLAVSGEDSSKIFSGNTVSTGKEATSGYNSKGTVDQFVEEINRSFAGKLRASNDNGKLRIENLSTQELNVSHDADGAMGPESSVSTKIAGNSIRENLAKQFNDLRDQLDKLADDSSFNGINLLRGDKLTITFNESGSSSIDIQAKDTDGNTRAISAQNLDVFSLVGEDLDNDADIDGVLAKLSTVLGTLRSQASTFGSNLSSVENRQSFTKNMINTLETGAANLTLADTNAEAANLLALQTRQQLSSSALSMASQQDQAVLQLLR